MKCTGEYKITKSQETINHLHERHVHVHGRYQTAYEMEKN